MFDMSIPVPMQLLTTVHGQFAAHVLAARLDDEGFDVTLRHSWCTMYALSVGELGEVGVYVPTDQIDDASYVLLVTEIDNALDEEPEETARRIRAQIPRQHRFIAAVVLIAAFAPIWRMVL